MRIFIETSGAECCHSWTIGGQAEGISTYRPIRLMQFGRSLEARHRVTIYSPRESYVNKDKSVDIQTIFKIENTQKSVKSLSCILSLSYLRQHGGRRKCRQEFKRAIPWAN
jgi:hypothetical protein